MALLALLLVLPSAAPGPTPEPLHPADGQRPNLVLLLGDDHPHDLLGCAGHRVLRTPALDRLAATGTRFRRALVSTPICAAARATLLTGRTERAHGYTFTRPPLDEGLRRESLPRLLRDAGYRVGLVGKLGVNLGPGGAGELFEELHPGTAPYLARDAAGEALPHLTERNAERAVAFLRAEDPRPFCLFLWFQAPHAEDANPAQFLWPESVDVLYREEPLPPPGPTESPGFFEQLPEFLRTGLNRERHGWRFDTPEKRERMIRGYYRLLSAMDHGVGRVLDTLEEEGLAGRTAVVYTGDNGYFLGERGYAGKWTMHERSVRVPLLVRLPAADAPARGETLDALVSHLDLAPTLLELAGVEVPAGMQGRSLLPLLRGEAPPWRREVFTEHLWDHPRIPRTEGLRTERWKYIRYLDHPEYEELYDLERDPHEARNLALEPAHAERLEELRARCAAAAERAAGDGARRDARLRGDR